LPVAGEPSLIELEQHALVNKVTADWLTKLINASRPRNSQYPHTIQPTVKEVTFVSYRGAYNPDFTQPAPVGSVLEGG
jgi:hypothetical protein